MCQDCENVVFGIIARIEKLGNLKMDDLRSVNGYGCDTPAQAIAKDKYKNRGQVMAEIIAQEFLTD